MGAEVVHAEHIGHGVPAPQRECVTIRLLSTRYHRSVHSELENMTMTP